MVWFIKNLDSILKLSHIPSLHYNTGAFLTINLAPAGWFTLHVLVPAGVADSLLLQLFVTPTTIQVVLAVVVPVAANLGTEARLFVACRIGRVLFPALLVVLTFGILFLCLLPLL